MNVLLIFACFAVFDGMILFCEGEARGQIWPEPDRADYFGARVGPPDPYGYRDFWMGPPRFDKPSRNEHFRNDLDSGDRKRKQDRNQNRRRTTTENLGPITSTPRTVHTAPRGCKCPMTQQFNPVCGTDGNTYRNKGLLDCYVRCGTKGEPYGGADCVHKGRGVRKRYKAKCNVCCSSRLWPFCHF